MTQQKITFERSLHQRNVANIREVTEPIISGFRKRIINESQQEEF
jgi:hypothetical protein